MRPLSVFILSFSSLLLLAASDSRRDVSPGATVSHLVGTAEVRLARASGWRPARINLRISSGDSVRTGDESQLELQWSHGGVIRLSEGSLLVLTSTGKEADSPQPRGDLQVLSGRVWANMKALATPGNSFSVQTPSAVAGIRGTVFRLDVDTDSATDVLVYQGAVAVAAVQSNRPDGGDSARAVERVEIEGPREVSLEEWVTIVAGQQIRMERSGSHRTWQFDKERDEQDPWVRGNLQRDRALDKKK